MGTTYKELFRLYDLIQNGDIRLVEKFLLESSNQLNLILPVKGIGVLHLAVGIDPLEKSIKCTELLLKHGADPNLCNDDDVTPVHIAAIWGRVDNLKLLIGCGGDPARRDLDGHSSFDYAVREQQWEIFDYLHNVVDQLDDSTSKCAYTLDLDKVLVTTDEMVAEYEAIADDPLNNQISCRKSEMVRQWCDQNSLVMNKLYPTILGETYLLENESVPWNSNDITQNISLDLTSNKTSNNHNVTNLSFKTCYSQKPVEISGIYTLDSTTEPSQNSILKPRISLYENFSLPGSPNLITHKNYNSKSSLKCRSLNNCCNSLTSDLEKLTLTDDSKNSSDQSRGLDKVLAVIQNKTNEWLSSSVDDGVGGGNTRRSSASSGVSSHLSSGSIVVASVSEEYKYEDKAENVVLIEKRLLVSPVVLPVEESDEAGERSVTSAASSLPASVRVDDTRLRAELLRLGFQAGPIAASTRTLYLYKLRKLRKTPITVTDQGTTYSIELARSLRSDDWMSDLSPYIELESKVRDEFANPGRKWREGAAKTSFTYLLLDPRRSRDLPSRPAHPAHPAHPARPAHSQLDTWHTFIGSIFYVGKGKRSRPYSHLYQALTLWKRNFTTSNDKKVQHILDIWSDKVGVVCLHVFQNVIPAEAYTNEAAMIDAIGLQNLKNLKCGNYYGVASSWPLRERRMLGVYLLYRAMLIFLSEGERQLRPDDID